MDFNVYSFTFTRGHYLAFSEALPVPSYYTVFTEHESTFSVQLLFILYLLFVYLFFYTIESGFRSLCVVGNRSGCPAHCTYPSVHRAVPPASGRHPGCALQGRVQHLHTPDLVRAHKLRLDYLHLHPAGAVAHCRPQAWPRDVLEVCTKHSPSDMRGSSWPGTGN